MKKDTLKGMIMVAIAGMIFGAFPVFTQLYVSYGGNLDGFNFYGFLLSAILVIPFILIRKTGFLLPKKYMLWTFLAAAANLVTRILLTYSYQYLDVGVATTLHFLYPLMTALLAFIIFHDRMPAYKWITFIVASLSVSLFVSDSTGRGTVIGIILAVLSSIGFATYMLIDEKAGVSGLDPFVVMFYVSLVGAIGCFIMMLIGGSSILEPIPGKALLILIACAILNNVIAFVLQLLGIKHLGAAMAAIISLFEPIFSCIFGAVFLGETMGIKSIIGIVLILGALTVMIILDNKVPANGSPGHADTI